VLFTVDHCVGGKTLINEDGRIFLPMFFEAENTVARLLALKTRSENALVAKYSSGAADSWLSSTGNAADGARPETDRGRQGAPDAFPGRADGRAGDRQDHDPAGNRFIFPGAPCDVALAGPNGQGGPENGQRCGTQGKHHPPSAGIQAGQRPFSFRAQRGHQLPLGVLIVDGSCSMIDIYLCEAF